MIKLNGKVIEQNHFPDGTLLMKENRFYYSSTIDWLYENDSELFTLYCLKRHIDSHSESNRTSLYMPYIPHARQDRVQNAEDVFTLKYFVEILNLCNFTAVYVRDPHSAVAEALINNVRVFDCDRHIKMIYGKIQTLNPDKDIILYYPDNGAYKKYSGYLNYPACYGVKKRDWETGKILGLDIMLNGLDIKEKTILMVDDIISYGGSMYYGAKALKELGCGDIYIYATHVENSILEGRLINSGLFKKIYTTESIFTKEDERIEVLK